MALKELNSQKIETKPNLPTHQQTNKPTNQTRKQMKNKCIQLRRQLFTPPPAIPHKKQLQKNQNKKNKQTNKKQTNKQTNKPYMKKK